MTNKKPNSKLLKIDIMSQTIRLRELSELAMSYESVSGVSAALAIEKEINRLHKLGANHDLAAGVADNIRTIRLVGYEGGG